MFVASGYEKVRANLGSNRFKSTHIEIFWLMVAASIGRGQIGTGTVDFKEFRGLQVDDEHPSLYDHRTHCHLGIFGGEWDVRERIFSSGIRAG
jgi:hypothetical protein